MAQEQKAKDATAATAPKARAKKAATFNVKLPATLKTEIANICKSKGIKTKYGTDAIAEAILAAWTATNQSAEDVIRVKMFGK